MTGEVPIGSDPADEVAASHLAGRQPYEDRDEVGTPGGTLHTEAGAEKPATDLIEELADRYNGTKTPGVDSEAILQYIGTVLRKRGIVDSNGRYIKKPA